MDSGFHDMSGNLNSTQVEVEVGDELSNNTKDDHVSCQAQITLKLC